MPDIFEHPGRPRRPHPGVFLVANHRLAAAQTQHRENPHELFTKNAQARFARVAVMERERIEVTGSGEMAAPIGLGRPGIEQDDIRVADDAPVGDGDVHAAAIRAEHAGRLHPAFDLRLVDAELLIDALRPRRTGPERCALAPYVRDAVAHYRSTSPGCSCGKPWCSSTQHL